MLIAGAFDLLYRSFGFRLLAAVFCFGQGANLAGWVRQINMAQFFSIKIAIKHIYDTPKDTQPTRVANFSAGFFYAFTMRGLKRAFVRVNAVSGQLNCGHSIGLMRWQAKPVVQQNSLRSGSEPIVLLAKKGRSEAPDRRLPLDLRLPDLYRRGMPRDSAQGNPMTLGQKLAWDDSVLPFQLDASDIRGRVARLDGVLDGILKQHDYPPAVEALVAEMALLTALIGQTIKLRWKLSLQIQSKGPVRMIATDYYSPTKEGEPARIRAYASFDADRLNDGTPFEQVGEGYFAVLIDQGEDMTPYQGITPIAGESLSDCAEAYFAQSEQIPTRFSLSFGLSTERGAAQRWRAGGVMLQHMPKASPSIAKEGSGEEGLLTSRDVAGDGDAGEDWNRVNLLLDTVDDLELIGPIVSPDELLVRLFHEETPRVFTAQPVRFGCTCSEDRVRQSLSIYSARDIETMTTPEGRVTADCQFCSAHYDLDPATVGFEANA